MAERNWAYLATGLRDESSAFNFHLIRLETTLKYSPPKKLLYKPILTSLSQSATLVQEGSKVDAIMNKTTLEVEYGQFHLQ